MLALLCVGCQSPEPTPQPSEEPTLYLAMSVHLEGWPVDDPPVFAKVLADIEAATAVYDLFGAAITWESKELTAASLQRDDTTLVSLDGGAHEVSVHADLGFSPTGNLTQERFESDLQRFADDFQNLFGRVPSNVSGICSELDWVEAALAAGFTGVSGTVEYCLKSLDEMPDSVADCSSPSLCHDGYPSDAEAKLHPWRTSDSGTWTLHDPAGDLVIIPAATGLKCNEEKKTQESPTSCEFTAADIDVYFDDLDAALEQLDPDQLNTFKGTYSQGAPLDLTLLEEWLIRLQPYLDEGRVEWATIDEIMRLVP